MNFARNLVAASVGAFTVALLGASSVVADSPSTMTIEMHGLNGSGQNGFATFTAVGEKVSVSVHILGEPSTASEPAHVHLGRCPVIRAVPAYNVGPIVNGKATNVVDLTWAELTSGKYVLNVHESTATLGKYMSCGDIGMPAVPIVLPTEDSGY